MFILLELCFSDPEYPELTTGVVRKSYGEQVVLPCEYFGTNVRVLWEHLSSVEKLRMAEWNSRDRELVTFSNRWYVLCPQSKIRLSSYNNHENVLHN